MKFTLALLSLAASALAHEGHKPAKRHNHELAARHNLGARNETQDLTKRAFSGRATWYDVTTGQGYCGGYRSPSDYVVALNQPQMDAQSVRCGDTITISANGRTAVATVWDECPSPYCPWGALDLSIGLFQAFNDLGVGVFQMEWWVGGDGGGGQQPPPPPPPTSTYVWTPDPTTWQPPSTSSTPAYTPPASSSSSSSATPSSSTGDNTIQEVPETTTSAPAQNFNNANNAILQLAEILRLAHNG